MQLTANTTTFYTRLRARLAALIAARPAAAESFSLYIPGEGLTGEFATIEQAEAARLRLPLAQRARATINDADGYCLCR